MRVFITTTDGEVPENILIEMQGDLVVPPNPAGQIAMFLHWPTATTPVCLLGHQMIQGKLTKLKNPLLVIDTRKSKSCYDSEVQEAKGECRIVMVIRQRLTFQSRPKSVLF
ncbi:hypothetical protein M3Y94_01235700 [Aphelenchoides besseyi]|nr:hypothetical protein M3Y94_01235700 [Aphelenchoides besseyi]KAI6217528.1 Chromosome transmission fidelity protein 8-like protein [Aphelenchoides besseyi]